MFTLASASVLRSALFFFPCHQLAKVILKRTSGDRSILIGQKLNNTVTLIRNTFVLPLKHCIAVLSAQYQCQLLEVDSSPRSLSCWNTNFSLVTPPHRPVSQCRKGWKSAIIHPLACRWNHDWRGPVDMELRSLLGYFKLSTTTPSASPTVPKWAN